MVYIPQTKSELYDKLGSMVLRAPHFDAGDYPPGSPEAAFAILDAGIDAVRKAIGEAHYAQMMLMSREALAFCKVEDRKAHFLLADMGDYVRKANRKRTVDEVLAAIPGAINYPPGYVTPRSPGQHVIN